MNMAIGCSANGKSQPKEPVRIIDANEAIEALDRAEIELYPSEYEAFQKEIDKIPTIDHETLRPTAHIRHGTYKETYDDAFCSRCNVLINNSENYDAIWYNHYKYCPHCGARFVSADE